MRVTLLGTIGWMPSDLRETTCFAVRLDEVLFILDAGTGLRRLKDEANRHLLDGVRAIHLFLTHYHLDHVCGLAYLPGVLPNRQITIHAAESGLTGVEPERALSGLLRRPYNPHDWKDLTQLRVEPIGAEAVIAGHSIQVRAQAHSDVSVAYRIDDGLVLATDTTADPRTAAFANGAGLLLHEAWYREADLVAGEPPPGYASHSGAEAVARLAAEAGVGRLVLIHLNPLKDESYYASLAATARRVFPAAEIRADGEVVDSDERPACR